MKPDSQEVKSLVEGSRVVVGTAYYNVYDTTSEAAGDLGEDKCLALINSQNRTDEMNKVRALSRPGVSKKVLRDRAMVDLLADSMEALIACAGDKVKLEALIVSKMETIKEEILSSAGAAQVEQDAEVEAAEEASV